MVTVVLGVDGGASKTHALVMDGDGRRLGFGAAGCGNHQSDGLQAALVEIRRAASEAMAQAGLAPQAIARACFCLAGADLDEDYAMLQEAVAQLGLAQQVVVKNDTMAALRAGLSRPYGVVVVCGTGFNAAGRGKDGRELILPGLGWLSGDWGGGMQLAHEVVRLVMRAWDGRGAPTRLREATLAALGAASEEALLRELYQRQISQTQLLALVPLLFEVAEAGDEPAQALIVRLGEEAATTATALLRRLDLLADEVEVVLAGGVFQGTGELLLETVRNGVRGAAPRAVVIRLQREPVVGAALLALEEG